MTKPKIINNIIENFVNNNEIIDNPIYNENTSTLLIKDKILDIKDYKEFIREFSLDKKYINNNRYCEQINCCDSTLKNRCIEEDDWKDFKYHYFNYINSRINRRITDKYNHMQILHDYSALYLDVDFKTDCIETNKIVSEWYINEWFKVLNDDHIIYDFYIFYPETIIENKYGCHCLIFTNIHIDKDKRLIIHKNIIDSIPENIDKLIHNKFYENDKNVEYLVFDNAPLNTCSTLLPFAEKMNATRSYVLERYSLANKLLGIPSLYSTNTKRKMVQINNSIDYNETLYKIFSLIKHKYWQLNYKETNSLFTKLHCRDINIIPIFYKFYTEHEHTSPTEIKCFERIASKVVGKSFYSMIKEIKNLITIEDIDEFEKLSDEFNSMMYKYVFENTKYSYIQFKSDIIYKRLTPDEIKYNISYILAKTTTEDYILKKDIEQKIIINENEMKKLLKKIMYKFKIDDEIKKVKILNKFMNEMDEYMPEYLGLKSFGSLIDDDSDLKYLPLFNDVEPKNYDDEIKNVKIWLEQFSKTFKNYDDFLMLMKREHFRLNNNHKPSQCTFAWYSEVGGCGKGLGVEMLAKLHKKSMPNLSEKAFQKEQLKSIITCSYVNIDEGSKSVKTDMEMKGKEILKSLFNTHISTRSMGNNDENIEVACDLDYCTNDRNLHGLYTNEEMHRRIIPVIRIKPKENEWYPGWLFTKLKETNFIRSITKYIKENIKYSGFEIGKIEKYNENNLFAKELIKRSNVLTNNFLLDNIDRDNEIINGCYELIEYNNIIYICYSKTNMLRLIKEIMGKEYTSIEKYSINHPKDFNSIASVRKTDSKSECFYIYNISEKTFSKSYSWTKFFIFNPIFFRNIIIQELYNEINNIVINIIDKNNRNINLYLDYSK